MEETEENCTESPGVSLRLHRCAFMCVFFGEYRFHGWPYPSCQSAPSHRQRLGHRLVLDRSRPSGVTHIALGSGATAVGLCSPCSDRVSDTHLRCGDQYQTWHPIRFHRHLGTCGPYSSGGGTRIHRGLHRQQGGSARSKEKPRRIVRPGGVMYIEMWPGADSNRRHLHFQCSALPTELPGRKDLLIVDRGSREGV